MSETHPDESLKQTRQRFFHGRRIGPLLTPFIVCLIVALLVYLFERSMPAFHEVVKIGYFIITVIFIVATGRAFRTRERGRRVSERRHDERRHSGRE